MTPIKTAQEVKSGLKFFKAINVIYEREGFRGYLRGLWPALVKATFNAGLYFQVLNYTESVLHSLSQNQKRNQFLASCLARAIQSILSNPIVIIKTRFEVVGFASYSGIFDGFRNILKQEGVKGLFTGLGVSLLRDVPFSGIYYPIYKTCQSVLMTLQHLEGKDPGLLIWMTSALLANLISCVVTQPLDIIRTRIMFQFHSQDENQQYKGLVDAFVKILQREGVRGMMRGLLPRIIRKGLGNIFAWSSYEYLVFQRKQR